MDVIRRLEGDEVASLAREIGMASTEALRFQLAIAALQEQLPDSQAVLSDEQEGEPEDPEDPEEIQPEEDGEPQMLCYDVGDGDFEECSLDAVASLVALGTISASTHVWTKAIGDDWLAYNEVQPLLAALNGCDAPVAPSAEPEPDDGEEQDREESAHGGEAEKEAEEEDEGLYYELADGEHVQVSWEEAAEKFAEGVITEETSIWCAGMADWATLAEARELDAGSRINAALPTI